MRIVVVLEELVREPVPVRELETVVVPLVIRKPLAAERVPVPERTALPKITDPRERLFVSKFSVPAPRFSTVLVDPAEAELPKVTVAFALLTVRPVKLFVPVRVRVPAPETEFVTVRLPELLAVPSVMLTLITLLNPLTSKMPPLVPIVTPMVGLALFVLEPIKALVNVLPIPLVRA